VSVAYNGFPLDDLGGLCESLKHISN
jgi:hypothetical protein